MAEISEEIISSELLRKKRRVQFKAPSASTDDTIVLGDYTTVHGCCLMKEDGTSVACTVSGNTITITGSVDSEDLYGFAIVS